MRDLLEKVLPWDEVQSIYEKEYLHLLIQESFNRKKIEELKEDYKRSCLQQGLRGEAAACPARGKVSSIHLATFQDKQKRTDLAIFLHDKNCTSNHTDDCGWYYEVSKEKLDWHDWNGYSHQKWFERAEEVLTFLEN